MSLADRVRELAAEVEPVDVDAAAAAVERQGRLVKPAGSLGELEEVAARLCAIARRCPPPVPAHPALVIAAADHGVHAQGVSPWPQQVTSLMVRAFCEGQAAANALARVVGASVTVLDVGVADAPDSHPLLRSARVRPGTADVCGGPAMDLQEAARAVVAGAGVAEELVAAGADLLLVGDMGIANSTTSACLISALTGAEPAGVTGRGTGVDDETFARKKDVVAAALERHAQDHTGHAPNPLGVLASLGGLEHAAMVGVILTAAAEGLPLLLDGLAADAAALVATALSPAAADYLVAGHRSVEPGATAALDHLGLTPLLDLQLRLGEGTGALLAVPLVQAAARALAEMATLEELGAVTPDAP